MIRKIAIIAATLCIMVNPINVYAADNTVTDLYGQEIELEDPESAGDEMDVITSTIKSEENCCQVNLKGSIPIKFALDIFVDFMNEDTGRTYRLYGLSKNEYRAFLFVPAGGYRIIQSGVFGDTTNKYPLTAPDDFILYENDIYTIETALVEEKEIKQEISERISENSDKAAPKYTEAVPDDNILNLKEIEYSEPFPWREIERSSNLEANVTVSGLSNGEYDIIIEFTKTGTVEEAEFIYSIDGGKSWSNNNLLTSNFIIEGTGLVFKFPRNDTTGLSKSWIATYKKGETIRFKSHPELSIKSATSKGAVINAYTTGVCKEDTGIVVKIVKSGTIKDAKFDYSTDGGMSFMGKELPMTDDYIIEETGLPIVLQFTDVAGLYIVNDTFSFEVYKEPKEIDAKIPILIIFLIIGSALFIGYLYLMSLKESDSIYTLNTYTPWSVRHPKKKKGKY